MQTLRELTEKEFWELYENRMTMDFPESEIRKKESFRELWEKGQYIALGWENAGELIGYGFFIQSEGIVLGDYFAIFTDKREKGSGRQFLDAVKEFFAPFSYVLIEVEDPDYSCDAEDKTHREWRISYFEKQDFFDTGVKTLVAGDYYRILVIPCGKTKEELNLNKESALERIEKIYKIIFTDLSYWKNIRITPSD